MTILVKKAMFGGVYGGLAVQMVLQGSRDPIPVLRTKEVQPGVQLVFQLPILVAQHGLPPAAEEHPIGWDIPVPEAQLSGFDDAFKPPNLPFQIFIGRLVGCRSAGLGAHWEKLS